MPAVAELPWKFWREALQAEEKGKAEGTARREELERPCACLEGIGHESELHFKRIPSDVL